MSDDSSPLNIDALSLVLDRQRRAFLRYRTFSAVLSYGGCVPLSGHRVFSIAAVHI